MSVKRNTREKVIDITIGPNDRNKWSKEKTAKITALAKLHHSKRSPALPQERYVSCALPYGRIGYS